MIRVKLITALISFFSEVSTGFSLVTSIMAHDGPHWPISLHRDLYSYRGYCPILAPVHGDPYCPIVANGNLYRQKTSL